MKANQLVLLGVVVLVAVVGAVPLCDQLSRAGYGRLCQFIASSSDYPGRRTYRQVPIKRGYEFIRFGRSVPTADHSGNRSYDFIRFGKRAPIALIY